MSLRLTDTTEPLNVLYYGDGGTGKTSDLASMANLGVVLFVNAESGLKGRPLRTLGVDTSNIEVWPDAGQRVTAKGLEQLHMDLLDSADEYVGVVWDSISEIYKTLLEDIVKTQVIRADRAGKERDPLFIDRADYGYMTEQVRSLVRRYRDLPMHFGMSALARREQDDDGEVTYQPAITPALQNDLIGWVDVVCATSVANVNGEDEYLGLFRPHSKYRGKDRLHVLPKWLIDPTFERILGYAEGNLTLENDPVMAAGKARRAAAENDGESVETPAPKRKARANG